MGPLITYTTKSNCTTPYWWLVQDYLILFLWTDQTHCDELPYCDKNDTLGGDAGGEVVGVVQNEMVEGKPVSFLLDTESARTLVSRELVPEEKVLGVQVVAVRCVHLESVHY